MLVRVGVLLPAGRGDGCATQEVTARAARLRGDADGERVRAAANHDHSGPLAEFVHVREGFIRLPNRGKIIPLSSAARSKLGQPLTGGLGDESGLYTASNRVLDTWQTMRRGIAAMQGRTVELTNPWDPMENSAAQQAFESRRPDIFRYYRKPPADLSYANKRDRHKIHLYVYADSPWVDVSPIDAEAAELVETDPTQAERFFGNRLVQGLGAYLTEELWGDAAGELETGSRSDSTGPRLATGRRCEPRLRTGTGSRPPTGQTRGRRYGILPNGMAASLEARSARPSLRSSAGTAWRACTATRATG